jgi:hypothetical protein
MLPEPPSNAEYLAAAYVITASILCGYVGMLWRRARKLFGRRSPP